MAKKNKSAVPLPPLPPIPGLPQVKAKLKVSAYLPPGSIKGKVGGTIKLTSDIPTEVPPNMLQKYPEMSLPEWIFWVFTNQLGYVEGEDFYYQYSLLESIQDEKRSPESTVADFYFPPEGKAGAPGLAIYVNGNYWHYERGQKIIKQDLDLINRIQTAYGYDVVVCDENDLMVNPRFIVREAIEFRRGHSELEGGY